MNKTPPARVYDYWSNGLKRGHNPPAPPPPKGGPPPTAPPPAPVPATNKPPA